SGLLHACACTNRKPPVGPDKVAGVAVWITFQVILMLRLRLPEVTCRGKFRHHLPRPEPRSVHVRDRFLGHSPLFITGVEDGRTVARANVITLTIERGRIVKLKEELQDLPVADATWIEHNLDRFSVGSVVA